MSDTELQQDDVAPQVDRREVLSQQFADLEGGSTNVSRETSKATAEKPIKEDKTGRAHDEKGKFASKQAAPELPLEGQPEEPLWKRPPASWKKDYHDAWKSADPRLQEYAYQREEQMRAGVEPLLPKAELADKINRVTEPYLNTIQGLGIDLPTAIEGLMKADHQLRTLPPDQKFNYLAQLARSYGIDISGAVQGQSFAPSAVDPNFYAIQNEVLNLKGQLTSFQQQQEQRENQNILGDINKFAQKAEFFEEVRPTMIQLLQGGVADDLEEAYEKAVRLNTELSDTLAQRHTAEANTASVAAKNMAAKAAKAAAVSVKSSTPGTKTSTKAQDRRSVIAEQFDSLSERF